MNVFPRQDIPETEKNQEWCKKCIDYAIDSFHGKNKTRIDNIVKNTRRYNGEIDEANIRYLTHTYGKKQLGKFIDYRLSRPKIDQMWGEFMSRPLNSTVYTINREAKSRKLDKVNLYKGLMEMKADGSLDAIQALSPEPLMNGMQVPDKGSEEAGALLNVKEENEIAMQMALNAQIEKLKLKYFLGFNWLQMMIGSEAFAKVDMDQNLKVVFRPIKNIDAIFEETDEDMFLEKTPYIGERRFMYLHDILSEYGNQLSEKDKELLKEIEGNWKDYTNSSYYGGSHNYYKEFENNFLIEVHSIEWKSSRPMYEKLIPREGMEPLKKFLSAEYYEQNINKIKKEVSQGKYKIETVWKTDLWRMTKIGHQIYLKGERKPYQIQTRESGYYEPKYSYTGLLFNTTEGKRVSLVELCENLSFTYNVIMFQINRELAKSKGKVIVYDRAFLPKNMTMKEVMYQVANDGIVDINTAADGNRLGREVHVNGQMREIDLGISQTIQYLLPLKAEIKRTLDELTGINEARQGIIAASATATNAQSSVMASRTITEPMFMYFNQFIENVLSRICNYTKIAWFVQESEEGEIILGEVGMQTLSKTINWSDDDYAVFLGDGGKENEIRRKIEALAETSLNAKELRYEDVIKIYLSESMSEAYKIARKGWEEIQRIAQESQKSQQESQQQIAQQQMETQIQLAREDREDRQAHELDVVRLSQGLQAVQKKEEIQLQSQLNNK